VLELPPYRRPQIIRVLVRSVFDKTLNVLSRAVMVAIPAGALIWILGNFKVGDTALLVYLCRALDSIGRVMGLDGVILAAFLLSFPANEIVLPLVIMGYTSSGVGVDVGMRELFVLRGWDVKMALCFVILCAFHMPCSTTLISIKKETGSIWWSVVAALLPSFVGVILCVLINAIFCIIL
jgi:ferrous iron transport protein B